VNDEIKELVLSMIALLGAIGLTWFGKIDGTAFGYSLLIILGAHKGAKVLGGLKSTKTVTTTTEAQP